MYLEDTSVEAQLKQRAQEKGLTYDPSDLEGYVRNTTYSDGNAISGEQALKNQFDIYDKRAASNGGPKQQAPTYNSPSEAWNDQPSGGGGGAAQAGGSSSDLYALLMDRARQGSAVGRNDPGVRAQVDPAVAQQERASRTYLDDIAERSGPLANLQGERRLAAERGGQAAGQLESEVIARETAARRDETSQALNLWSGRLSTDQQQALQREIAKMEDAARTADRSQQESQFSRGLSTSNDQFLRGLSTSNDQFLRELALREYDTTNKWDYQWGTL